MLKIFYRAETNTPASDFPIPLPAPGDFDAYTDFAADPIDTNGGTEHGPFLPSNQRALNNLFTDTGETEESSANGMFISISNNQPRRLF